MTESKERPWRLAQLLEQALLREPLQEAIRQMAEALDQRHSDMEERLRRLEGPPAPPQEDRLPREREKATQDNPPRPEGPRPSAGGPAYCSILQVTFSMGSPPGESKRTDEPQHSVTIQRPFLLKATPVTQGEWQSLMGNNPSVCPEDDHPVNQVSWYDAVAYCNMLSQRAGREEAYVLRKERGHPGEGNYWAEVTWRGLDCLGYRLPTEAEWEHACRAYTSGSRYGELRDIAWHEDNSQGGPHSVGWLQPNSLGLYDMLGNVWEWVWDLYQATYYNSCPILDPCGPDKGFSRVLRGASWSNSGALCRAAFRGHDSPENRRSDGGFRPARTVFG